MTLTNEIDDNENILILGMDSISILKVVTELEDEYNIEMTISPNTPGISATVSVHLSGIKVTPKLCLPFVLKNVGNGALTEC
ncbi:MAG TPA: hypothetical protein DIW41_11585 [Lachnospiraceae bacterium]|nr:hypothetical protein [Lachnospiraceae bacterium]